MRQCYTIFTREAITMVEPVMKSAEVRDKWRDILDSVHVGQEIVIERYNKPAAVVINFDKWRILKQRYFAELDRISQEMREGDFFTQEELDAELRKRGLIE